MNLHERIEAWIAQQAPWLLPLGVVVALNFLVAPLASKNAFNRTLGSSPRLLDAASSESDKPEPASRPEFSEGSVRLNIWAEVLSAALSGEGSASRHEDSRGALALGSAGLRGEISSGVTIILVVLTVSLVVGLRYLRIDRLGPPAIRRVFLCTTLSFLALSWVTYDEFTAPKALVNLGEGHSSPVTIHADKGPSAPTYRLYWLLHGVDPWAEDSTGKPVWDRVDTVRAEFERTARWTLWFMLGAMVVSATGKCVLDTSVADLRRGAVSGAQRLRQILITLLLPLYVLILVLHGFQWFWLAEGYGSLIEAGSVLKRAGILDEARSVVEIAGGADEIEPTHAVTLSRERHLTFWPFRGTGLAGDHEALCQAGGADATCGFRVCNLSPIVGAEWSLVVSYEDDTVDVEAGRAVAIKLRETRSTCQYVHPLDLVSGGARSDEYFLPAPADDEVGCTPEVVTFTLRHGERKFGEVRRTVCRNGGA